jgi:hypothetical protein
MGDRQGNEPLTAGVLLQVLDEVEGGYLGMAKYYEERENETSSDMYRAQRERNGREARIAARLVGAIAYDLRERLGIEEPA